MIISSKGRYALRVMIDLAEHNTNEFISLKEISSRQGISQKYLESIVVILSKNHLVEGVSGKGGGYRLRRKPEEYRLGDILRLTEGSLKPVSCLEEDTKPCEKVDLCYLFPIWQELSVMIDNYFDSITLSDILQKHKEQNCECLRRSVTKQEV